MLKTEDRALTPRARIERVTPGISAVLRAVRPQVERGAPTWEVSDRDEIFRISVTSDRSSRERAYRLAQRVYSGRGYASGKIPWAVTSFDAEPQTFTLLAEDDQGADAATITLVFDSAAGLPCDEIFAADLHALRARGRRLVEVTRLAIDEKHQRSKLLLVRLFNLIAVFAYSVRNSDEFLIEVNPRHVNYYRRLLFFEPAGPQRPCPRVQGAPAVLLRLDLHLHDREVRRVGGQGAASGERSLYPYFYPSVKVDALADFLARHHQAMSADDVSYFGLDCRATTRF